MATAKKLNSPDLYTVGWIAALPIERAAATAMLDDRHDKPGGFIQHQSDTNSYTWGNMGEHNVVIASLPAGLYGTTSAATTASNLLSSLPQIRIGLLVGIGGGIARPEQGHDIRLGDIVVSQPQGTTGGVIQYDLGKAKPNQNWERKDFLSMPPQALLQALASLQAEHELGESRVPQLLGAIPRKMARAVNGYIHQGFENDQLFKSSYNHVAGHDCCSCDATEQVKRGERDSTDPVIHYGIIASGNTLVKDAAIRDKIVEDAGEECICLEMEAAGLMNHFPCLVIRGICDYADSHKNDRWQRYASATAAAYGRELLSYVPVRDLQETQRALVVLSSSENIKDIQFATTDTKMVTKRLKSDSHFNMVKEWLRPPDMSTNLNEAQNKRQEGTGSWFLQSKPFKEWKSGTRQNLWLHGIPGCGKTVLSAAIIEDLRQQLDSSHFVLYFFFDFTDIDKQSLDKLVRSLVAQLYSRCDNSRKDLDKLFSSCGDGFQQPTYESLFTTFLQMVNYVGKIYIVIDALDECKTRKDLLFWMGRLAKFGCAKLHLLTTSRREEDIESELKRWLDQRNIVPIHQDLVSHDIQAYIHGRLHYDHGFERWRSEPSVQDEIEIELMKKADGMFRWAACQLDILQKCLDLRMLRESLSSLPKTLQETYAQILASIDEIYRPYTIRILQFLTYSKRPLTIQEAVDILVVDPDRNPPFDPKLRMPEPRDILKTCSSLVSLVTKQAPHNTGKTLTELKLAHVSVQQYLKFKGIEATFPSKASELGVVFQTSMNEINARGIITRICLAYLSHLDERCPVRLVEEFPLAQYSVQYWMEHARPVETERNVQESILEFFLQKNRAYAVWINLLHADSLGRKMLWQRENRASPLYYASSAGFQFTVGVLLEKGINVNAEGGFYGTALQAACAQGHKKVAQMLLDKGANVNAQGGYDTEMKSALHYAASQNNKMLIQLLLKYGAKTEAQDICGQTPLLVAAGNTKVEAVIELLSQGATVNALDAEHRNALHLAIIASRAESTPIADMLLSHSIDFNVCDVGNMTPLHYAVGTGSCEIIDSLLKAGVDVNMGIERKHWTKTVESGRPVYRERQVPEAGKQKINDIVGLTPLHFAACIGYNAMTEYLLSKGADPNARCHNGETPLHIALRGRLFESQNGLFRYVLPDHDEWTYEGWRIELNTVCITDHEGEEAREIYQYIEEGRLAVINTLLACTGINVNIQNIEHRAPLHMVKYNNCNAHAIVCKLLKLGADIFARYNGDQTALHLACNSGASTIACDFLDRGCSIKTTDLQGLNALHYAVRADRHDTVRMILGRDEQLAQSLCRDVDARGRTLVHHHLEEGMECSIEMLTVLLCHGSRLDDVDQDGNTPLSLYLQGFSLLGQMEICHFLLEHGADALWRSPKGQNLAHLAMYGPVAALGVLGALSNHGVDVTAKDTSGKSILHYGAIHGTLSKEILNFIQRNNLHLDDKDAQGKTSLMYAEEEASKERHCDLFAGDRWQHTLENLRSL